MRNKSVTTYHAGGRRKPVMHVDCEDCANAIASAAAKSELFRVLTNHSNLLTGWWSLVAWQAWGGVRSAYCPADSSGPTYNIAKGGGGG